MSLSNERGGGYSAHVELTLIVAGDRIELAQVGHQRIYLRSPMTLPAGPAELIVQVDGNARRKNITIPPGQGTAQIFDYTVA